MWRENDVGVHRECTKILHHPIAGRLALEYSSFAINGHPGLTMIVYNPATPEMSAGAPADPGMQRCAGMIRRDGQRICSIETCHLPSTSSAFRHELLSFSVTQRRSSTR